MLKVSGGNSGIMAHGNILSNTNQACPRRIVLRNHKIEENLTRSSHTTFAIGRACEAVFTEEFPSFEMNVRFPEMPMITENVALGAECDAYDRKDGTVYELKSVSSTNALKDIFVLGKYKQDNLIQLALYMLVFNSEEMPVHRGVLRYLNTVYHKMTVAKVEHKFKAGDVKEFRVQWNGEMLEVDGKPVGITADSISRFLEYAAFILETNPPVNEVLTPVGEDGTRVACMYCHWREECSAAEQLNLTMQDFIDLCAKKT